MTTSSFAMACGRYWTPNPAWNAWGEATTGEEAVRLSTEVQPDVMLMDVQMPGMSGVEATRQIVSSSPQIRVLAVTMFMGDMISKRETSSDRLFMGAAACASAVTIDPYTQDHERDL